MPLVGYEEAPASCTSMPISSGRSTRPTILAGSGANSQLRVLVQYRVAARITTKPKVLSRRMPTDLLGQALEPGAALRVDEEARAVLHSSACGSAWRWAEAIREDPIHALFTEAAAVSSGALKLAWSSQLGRHAVTQRAVKRGEELRSSPPTRTHSSRYSTLSAIQSSDRSTSVRFSIG